MLGLGNKITPRMFTARADQARDEARYRDAAALYREAIALAPRRGDLHLQAGHMFKEAGEFAEAGEHYDRAAELMPGSAEVALQLGHFHKLSGRLADAEAAYRRALELQPGWDLPIHELTGLRRTGWRGEDGSRPAAPPLQPMLHVSGTDDERRTDGFELAGLYGKLAPELVPRPERELIRYASEELAIRQFGVQQNSFWGQKRVARGVEAVRGMCVSRTEITQIAARVNGLLVHKGSVMGPYELQYEPDKSRIHKYTFNLWIDFSPFAPGLYELELTFARAGEESRVLREEFVVEAPLREADHPHSDGVIELNPSDRRSIDEQVQGRPSILHEAERANQIGEVRSILLARSDQLGDLVASIPGILRVRELFPEATLVGLCGPANADLARSLGVFDDVVVIDHVESWHQRLRTLTLAEQEVIRAKLAPYRFDVAVDLSQSLMGRSLLALTGARFLYGFPDPGWARLTSSFNDTLFDPKNRREAAAHSKRILSLVDRLGTLTQPSARVIRRTDLDRERLSRFGLKPGDRYAALHAGARIVWSRWKHFPELAGRILRETDLKVVLFGSSQDVRDQLPSDLRDTDRLVVLDELLPFDDFDALLQFAEVYVGNDSGPKHLASLRGVPVVSIHSARINWSEWGQEHTGVIVSRKVPCAGCHIYHDPEECGKGFACMAISLEDVYVAVRRYI